MYLSYFFVAVDILPVLKIGRVMHKQVFGAFVHMKVQEYPVCLNFWYYLILIYQRTARILIRLHKCANL